MIFDLKLEGGDAAQANAAQNTEVIFFNKEFFSI